jgi:hypothetical protein
VVATPAQRWYFLDKFALLIMFTPSQTYTNGVVSLGLDTVFNWLVLTTQHGWLPINQMQVGDIRKVQDTMAESKEFPPEAHTYVQECITRFSQKQPEPVQVEQGKAITNFSVTFMLDGENRWCLMTKNNGWERLEALPLETLVQAEQLMSGHAVFPLQLREYLRQLIAQHKKGPTH